MNRHFHQGAGVFAKILSKKTNDVEDVDDAKRTIDLAHPSIVQLQHIGPEEVKQFSREGADLKILLTNGNVITVQNFFVKDSDGVRSDLVLIDDQGVMWWGQYGDHWAGFDFAEIETDSAIIPLWLWWGLAALGVAGAAAAVAAGQGDDGGDDNAAPVAQDNTNSGAEYTALSGNVLTNSSDPDGDPLTVAQFTIAGDTTIYAAGDTANITNVGTLTINSDGSYSFTPVAGYSGTVPPVTYTISDGRGGTDTATLDLSVIGVNIVDDASPATPTAGDNVLASIDDLNNVVIDGQIAAGSTLTALSVSDGTDQIAIDPATVTINPDGSFSTTADLSALQDGPLTVTLTAEDPFGNSATTTDQILKGWISAAHPPFR